MTPKEFHQFLIDATRKKIESGVDYWNTSTLEYIFHDEDYDGPDVFGISILNSAKMVDNPLDGYCSDNDEDIDRNKAAEMVVFGGCWWPIGHERQTEAIGVAKMLHGKKDAENDAWNAWKGEGFYHIKWSDDSTDLMNDGPVWFESVLELKRELECAFEDSTPTHLPYAEYAEKQWIAYDQEMIAHQDNESYMHEMNSNEWDCWEDFDTQEQAREWCKKRLKELEETGDATEIIRTKRGLDTLIYHDLYITACVEDKCSEEYVFVDSTLTDELQERLNTAQRRYHEYLDYADELMPWSL